MFIAALHIENHFLFEEPQTINFGGKYIYDFRDPFNMKRTLNEKYIPNFYAEDTVELVSAIVGENGAGKTTLLKTILDIIHGKSGSSDFIIVMEYDDYALIHNTIPIHPSNISFDTRQYSAVTETIYYSPFLDFKEPLPGIDLSYDSILEEDLDDMSFLFQASNTVIPSRRLKTKNALRQLEFQYSDYGKSLAESFSYPVFNRSKITFTRHKIEVDRETNKIQFHNTPFDLQFVLQPLFEYIQYEAKEINEKRVNDNFQKDLFKNYIIMDILCLFIKQMEKTNDYLTEGHISIKQKEFVEKLKGLNSTEALFLFLDIHFYNINSTKQKLLPIEETKTFIIYLFEIIDDLENDFFNWNDKAIYLEKEKTQEIILFHNKFLNEIDKYYLGVEEKTGEVLFEKRNRIEGIINFEPSDKSLSSGENALLNFYSRIYDYFKTNMIDVPTVSKAEFYLIFLDEADLGFHPKWKKKFVKETINFIKEFFKSLDLRVQIIFTTHDPLTLSDILNYNIVYLEELDNKKTVVDKDVNPKRSFGANITDLLADSFFIEDGLIGHFAKDKINETIQWLNYKKLDLEVEELKKNRPLGDYLNLEVAKIEELSNLKADIRNDNSYYHERLISLIDEPILKTKLMEMYSEVYGENNKESEIELKRLADKLGYNISPKSYRE
ncbi:AAA family ATPase [Winogradskyella thalassocola]|uniref:ABC transporter n=1 Tax=Winogradskyella thalassocola TaxID=262004 RepID=A0A1G7ZNA0_9FLAO|nr:AAA family ATPase [Winogradskyella thalassocola]SDH10144.1 ABC transporter [Winogradskyella thalassocola]